MFFFKKSIPFQERAADEMIATGEKKKTLLESRGVFCPLIMNQEGAPSAASHSSFGDTNDTSSTKTPGRLRH